VNDIKASLTLGIALILLGAWLIRWHRAVWGQHRGREPVEKRGLAPAGTQKPEEIRLPEGACPPFSTGAETAGDDRERRHYRLQFRRRVQVSALLILLGIMIPIGDWLMVQRRNLLWMTVYWIVVLILALWIMLLAAIDWLSTRMFVRATRATLAGLARKQRELEAEAERLRGRGSNGRH
jgi:hypothetical protein